MVEAHRIVRGARGDAHLARILSTCVFCACLGESLRASALFCQHYLPFLAFLRNASFLRVGPQRAITRWRRAVRFPRSVSIFGSSGKLNLSASARDVPSSHGVALRGSYKGSSRIVTASVRATGSIAPSRHGPCNLSAAWRHVAATGPAERPAGGGAFARRKSGSIIFNPPALAVERSPGAFQ